jgi:hypothetical protein
MRYYGLFVLAVWVTTLTSCKFENPVMEGYPCGTRAHACSIEPLSCCFNYELCSPNRTCQSNPDQTAFGRSKQWTK